MRLFTENKEEEIYTLDQLNNFIEGFFECDSVDKKRQYIEKNKAYLTAKYEFTSKRGGSDNYPLAIMLALRPVTPCGDERVSTFLAMLIDNGMPLSSHSKISEADLKHNTWSYNRTFEELIGGQKQCAYFMILSGQRTFPECFTKHTKPEFITETENEVKNFITQYGFNKKFPSEEKTEQQPQNEINYWKSL